MLRFRVVEIWKCYAMLPLLSDKLIYQLTNLKFPLAKKQLKNKNIPQNSPTNCCTYITKYEAS